MNEHEIQNRIRVSLSDMGYIVFRANVGKIKLPDGRWFDTGLPKGFSDLFAIDNKGHVSFIECKNSVGKPTPEQVNFLGRMEKQGCYAGIARGVKDAILIVSGSY